MKRIAVVLAAGVVVAATAAVVLQDPVGWKRRLLAASFDPANLPAAYYQPSVKIEGANGPEPPRVSPEYEQLDPAALAAAVEYADSQHTRALIVGRHGHIVFEHYWDGSGFDTVIDAGAFNAALTALMVGVAIDDHKIALPIEPVANYLESFRREGRDGVALADLLHMTSGLGSGDDDEGSWVAPSREQFSQDVRAECLERQLAEAPGMRWQAQACDPQLLVEVIERATGKPYPTYVSERLWKPIGAADAALMLDREGGTAYASCCLRARQGDWMRIAELLVNEGKFEGEQVVAAAWVRAMRTAAPANPNFGYQVWLGDPFEPGGDGKGAGGNGGASSEPYASDDTFLLKAAGKTRLWLIPSMRLAILRVGGNDENDAAWDDSRIPNLIVRGASDYVPKAPAPGSHDISTLVPNH